jgi:hypothetical protein
MRIMRAWARLGAGTVLVGLVFTLPLSHSPTLPRLSAQETSLTVYSDGRLLVRRTLPVAVARGVSTIAADLGVREADPASITSLDDGVQVKGVRVFGAVGLEGSLRRSVGREVVFRTGPDSAPGYVRGTLLSLDPPAVRVGGYVLYGMPGTPVFPDSMVQLEPRVEVTIDAARAASALRLMYMSTGLNWQASYALVLPPGGAGEGTVTGTAQIANGASLTLRGAQVQLLAGEVRRAAPQLRLQAGVVERVQVSQIMATGEATGEALGGTHLYTLPGTVDFAPGETRTIALFAPSAAAVEPEFALRNQGYGVVNEWPDAQRDQHPEIAYRIRRPAASPFGGTPLPAGTMRVFEPDAEGRPQLVGEAAIGHSPAGRDVRVTTGTAFDVTATRTQTAFVRRGDRESESAYRVDLQNAKTQSVTVLVTDACPARCEIVSSSLPGEQPSASTVSFRVSVPAGGAASLEYRIRARW